MDVDKLIRSDAARTRLDLVAPPRPPRSDAPLLAPPTRADPKLVQTALHYLIRSELQRRHLAARSVPWLADEAPARLAQLAPELEPRAISLLEAAKDSHAHFLRSATPRSEQTATMAAHALRLARLDAAVRAGYVDARISEDERAEDVDDLARMLAVVPWQTLGGGASADLGHSDMILDGRLLLVRAGRTASVDVDDVRSLLARLVLARDARAEDPDFPEVREISVYAARHARSWTAPVADIVAKPGFAALETWIRERLREDDRGAAKPPAWARKRKSPGFGSAAQRKVGKAENKKPDAKKPAPKVPGAKAAFRDEPPAPPADPDPKRPSKPDWRKNSQWRKERGL